MPFGLHVQHRYKNCSFVYCSHSAHANMSFVVCTEMTQIRDGFSSPYPPPLASSLIKPLSLKSLIESFMAEDTRGAINRCKLSSAPGTRAAPHVEALGVSPHGRQIVLDLVLNAPLNQSHWQPQLQQHPHREHINSSVYVVVMSA